MRLPYPQSHALIGELFSLRRIYLISSLGWKWRYGDDHRATQRYASGVGRGT